MASPIEIEIVCKKSKMTESRSNKRLFYKRGFGYYNNCQEQLTT
jgi:hypothetical protein